MGAPFRHSPRNSSFFLGTPQIFFILHSFGFAFADVDLPYIEKICSLIDTRDITWHLNDYDCIRKRKEYQKKLKKCGFQGKFSTFTTK